MCQVLGVSPSGFYAWRNRPKSKRQRANEELLEHVKVAHEETGRRTYGSPRVTSELHAQGCGDALGLRPRFGACEGQGFS